MDELDAADIEATGGLVEDQQLEVTVELAGHDELLLVAAGQRPGGHARGRRAHVVLLDGLVGACGDGGLVAHEPM